MIENAALTKFAITAKIIADRAKQDSFLLPGVDPTEGYAGDLP
jgi:hypothetical protein